MSLQSKCTDTVFLSGVCFNGEIGLFVAVSIYFFDTFVSHFFPFHCINAVYKITEPLLALLLVDSCV